MENRLYTVAELDALRSAVERKWLYGTYRIRRMGGISRSYRETEKTSCVEEMVRTHMLAGHTADDLLASEPLPETEDAALA